MAHTHPSNPSKLAETSEGVLSVNAPASGSVSPSKLFDDSRPRSTSFVENPTRKEFKVPNPLKSLKLLWSKDTALITLIFGIFYMNLSSLQTSTSTLLIGLYGISDLQAGLIYLPSGIGSCIGAYGAGKSVNASELTSLSAAPILLIMAPNILWIHPLLTPTSTRSDNGLRLPRNSTAE